MFLTKQTPCNRVQSPRLNRINTLFAKNNSDGLLVTQYIAGRLLAQLFQQLQSQAVHSSLQSRTPVGRKITAVKVTDEQTALLFSPEFKRNCKPIVG